MSAPAAWAGGMTSGTCSLTASLTASDDGRALLAYADLSRSQVAGPVWSGALVTGAGSAGVAAVGVAGATLLPGVTGSDGT